MRNPAWLLLLPLLSITQVTTAEDLVGSRLRIKTAGSVGALVGDLVSEDARTLTLVSEGTQRTIERERVTSLEVSRQRSHKRRGFFIGFATGAALGVGLGYAAAAANEDCEELFCDAGVSAGQVAGVFGVAGGLLGGAIGTWASPGERWEQVPGVRLSVGPARGRGVAASLRFSF